MSEQHIEFYNAARDGDMAALVKAYLQGPYIDARFNENQWTALHAASAGGHVHVIDRLLTWGAYVNGLDASDLKATPLMLATEYGNPQAMKMLIACGANANLRTAQRDSISLIAARTRANADQVWDVLLHPDTKLSENDKPTSPDGYGTLLLFEAIVASKNPLSDLTSATALIRHGADWRELSDFGESILHMLIRQSKVYDSQVRERQARVVMYLLVNGVSPFLENSMHLPAYQVIEKAPEVQRVFDTVIQPLAEQAARFHPSLYRLVGEDGQPTPLALSCCYEGKIAEVLDRERWGPVTGRLQVKEALFHTLPEFIRDQCAAQLDTAPDRRREASLGNKILRKRLGLPKERREL